MPSKTDTLTPMSPDSRPASARPIRILIAEDHQLTRQGLLYSLQKQPQFEVVGQAANGQRALEAAQSELPDVILMDIGMPVMDGISATQAIKQLGLPPKVVILTSHQDEDEVLASLTAGADAYCLKDISADRLMAVIELVQEGGVWLDPAIAGVVLNHLHPVGLSSADKSGLRGDLTDRELDVLRAIVGGQSNKEIALTLDISLHTVKSHVCNIIQKLSVDDRTQAAIKALKEGLL